MGIHKYFNAVVFSSKYHKKYTISLSRICFCYSPLAHEGTCLSEEYLSCRNACSLLCKFGLGRAWAAWHFACRRGCDWVRYFSSVGNRETPIGRKHREESESLCWLVGETWRNFRLDWLDGRLCVDIIIVIDTRIRVESGLLSKLPWERWLSEEYFDQREWSGMPRNSWWYCPGEWRYCESGFSNVRRRIPRRHLPHISLRRCWWEGIAFNRCYKEVSGCSNRCLQAWTRLFPNRTYYPDLGKQGGFQRVEVVNRLKSSVEDYCGHGIGRYMHMLPFVLHFENQYGGKMMESRIRSVLLSRPGVYHRADACWREEGRIHMGGWMDCRYCWSWAMCSVWTYNRHSPRWCRDFDMFFLFNKQLSLYGGDDGDGDASSFFLLLHLMTSNWQL